MFSKIRKSLRRNSNNSNQQNSNNSSQQQGDTTSKGRRQSANLSPQNNNPFTGSTPTRRPNSSSNMNTASPSEPPPAYTASPVSGTTQPAPSTTTTSVAGEDPYIFLKSFDTIFLIDDSGSMAGRSWYEVSEALKLIAPVCAQHDDDGIDIYFLNHPDSSMYKNVKDASTVVEIFQTVRPRASTPTGQKLNSILKPYLQRYEASPESTKPVNIIVITDGEPTDDLESPIIAAAKKLDRLEAPAWQVGIQFFQVGKEEQARAMLKSLDDDLREISKDPNLRDMVDTVEYQGDDGAQLTVAGVMKVVLGSVNRRLDRNSKELHRR
ncbi:von Willebrand factor [Massarina eburnea CBS 473.64]|uniref:von Willebrand factor n=1 Tax=Massarina eburnea CBS 473.64 TaxID=1395130 RepID=A0A6A6S259_9PLEO|nr:von Willebrand factor [Massarina eburnea CBS 473.64]